MQVADQDDQNELDYNMNELRESFISRMKAEGYDIVYPAANELQIDIDSDEQYAVFKQAIACVNRNWEEIGEVTYEEHPSKSGFPSRHITAKMPFDVEPWQRIALQAALGSDPIRELLSATRMLRGDIHPTLFVELKPWEAL